MTALPAASAFTAATTQGAAKTAYSDQRDFLSGLFGTDGTIATALKTLGVPFAGVLAKTAAYTAVIADRGRLIDVDATAASVVITLPTAAAAGDGFSIIARKNDASANTVTINGQALANQNDVVLAISDGTSWVNITLQSGDSTTAVAKIDSGTVTAGSSFSHVLDNATYRNFKLVLTNITTSVDGSYLYLRTSGDGGSTYDAGSADYVWAANKLFASYTSTTNTVAASNGATKITLNPSTAIGNAAGEQGSVVLDFLYPAAADHAVVRYLATTESTGGNEGEAVGHGRRKSTTPVDAFEITLGSGTVTFDWALYGEK